MDAALLEDGFHALALHDATLQLAVRGGQFGRPLGEGLVRFGPGRPIDFRSGNSFSFTSLSSKLGVKRQPDEMMNPHSVQPSGELNESQPVNSRFLNPTVGRLAVCSWSLQPDGINDLIAKVRACDISKVQLALDPVRQMPAAWRRAGDLLKSHHITLASGMFGCVREDYSTLETIQRTGGLAPDATWPQNLRNIQVTADLAAELELQLVTFHAGFLPDDESAPGFIEMLSRLRTVAEIFASKGIALGLETGQETATVLAALLKKLDCPNVGVNFDPANMILYGKGDPIAALRILKPWIRQVHLKDAIATRTPGTWGEEVPLGQGQVDWQKFFATLKELQYEGDYVIEREAGVQRIADIRTARDVFMKWSH